MRSCASLHSLKSPLLRVSGTRSLTSTNMTRQLRSSANAKRQEPYKKITKANPQSKATKVVGEALPKPAYTQLPVLGPSPPPSAPPGQKKVLNRSPPDPVANALFFESPEKFDEWLEFHISGGLDSFVGYWLRLAKKACPTLDLTYDQALPVALAHGWIDGQRKSIPGNHHYFIQRFTPRRKNSMWSKRNVGIVEQLMEEGKMKDLGMKEVQAAKEDGRWERAYSGANDIKVPEDFEALLRENQSAWNSWERASKGDRYLILMKLETTKSAEGREKKMKDHIKTLASS